MSKFKHGNFVTWTSQAGGITRTKLGEVVEVVPPRTKPNAVRGSGMSREHESYVVKASVIDGKPHQLRRTKRYWPKVELLNIAAQELRDNVQRRIQVERDR